MQIIIFAATLVLTAMVRAAEPTPDQGEAAPLTVPDPSRRLFGEPGSTQAESRDLPLCRDLPLDRPSAIYSLPVLENRALFRRTPRLKPPALAHRKKPAEVTEERRTPDDLSKPYWEWEHATGDWGGVRPWLWEHGVIPELLYTGEGFGDVHGGLRRGSAYRGKVDLTLSLDTERLGFWPGGTSFVDWQNGHGRGISEREVGALQLISSIEAHAFTQISAFYYQQKLFGEGRRIKLSKQDANVDFAALDYAVNFLHSSFGLIPNVPMPTFPDPALGLAVFAKPVDLCSAAG